MFTCWRLDRAGRSTLSILELLRTLEDRKIGFRSLTEGVDTTTPAGKMLATMLSAFAQMEREIIIERTHAGLAAARARGRIGGRPRALTAVQVEQAQLMHKRGTGVSEIAATLDMGRSTVYRALEQKSTASHAEPSNAPAGLPDEAFGRFGEQFDSPGDSVERRGGGDGAERDWRFGGGGTGNEPALLVY